MPGISRGAGRYEGRCSRPGYRSTRRDRAAGFALLGLLVFIAVLGLMTAGVATTGELVARRAAEQQLLYVGLQYRKALQLYAEATPSGQSRFPRTLADLLEDRRYPEPRRYLRALYPDPITKKNDWVLMPSPDGGVMGLHSRSAAEPLQQVNFNAPFEHFANLRKYSDWTFFYYVGIEVVR